MARRWPKPVEPQPPAELLDFDPDDWILGGRGNPVRAQIAFSRWHEARFEWVMVDSRTGASGGWTSCPSSSKTNRRNPRLSAAQGDLHLSNAYQDR
jgi:hypothetical protein